MFWKCPCLVPGQKSVTDHIPFRGEWGKNVGRLLTGARFLSKCSGKIYFLFTWSIKVVKTLVPNFELKALTFDFNRLFRHSYQCKVILNENRRACQIFFCVSACKVWLALDMPNSFAWSCIKSLNTLQKWWGHVQEQSILTLTCRYTLSKESFPSLLTIRPFLWKQKDGLIVFDRFFIFDLIKRHEVSIWKSTSLGLLATCLLSTV